MAILLLADHEDDVLSDTTAKVVSAARQIGGDIHVLVAGKDCNGIAAAAAGIDGVAKVLVADAESLSHQLAEPMADLLVSLAGDYDVLIAAAGSVGKNTMPRAAALLDVMQVSEIIAVKSADTFERPIYAGNAIETVQSGDAKKVITVRATSFESAGSGNSAPIALVAVPADGGLSGFVSKEGSKSDRPDLGSARIVISGGRALGSSEQFDALILPLAEKLGAAVGASRAAVDAGFVPNDYQVGQTGKIVAPELYIACGISGAIQHLAGMKDSKIIVAINKDEDAPIFQVADYGLVADLFDVLPELTDKI
jgi:electron transfer flavoprotein alpha subunit